MAGQQTRPTRSLCRWLPNLIRWAGVATGRDGPPILTLAAPSDSPLVASLLDDYLEELSRHREVPIGASDAASYPYLEAYWRELERFPFIIGHPGEVVGLVFVRRRTTEVPPLIEVAELYIRPAHRRRGIGTAVLDELCDRYPGDWELQVHAPNAGALRFWASSIERITGNAPVSRDVQARHGRRVQFNFHV